MEKNIYNQPEAHLTTREAREFMQLQAEICKKLKTDRVSSVTQLEPGLIEPTRVHLVICKVENHQPIDGIFVDDNE